MRGAEHEAEGNGEQLWSMGAVSRHTGLGEHTLRAWERRFGFPQPTRLPSGHRRFTGEQVRRLVLVSTALSRGLRAGDVVPLPVERLEALVRESDAMVPPPPPNAWLPALLDAARALDRRRIVAALQHDAVTLGLRTFLQQRVAPLLEAVGAEWQGGRLGVRHEHLLTEALNDVLRGLREPLEAGARGRPVVLASLPGELHALGLQLVVLTVVGAGRRVAMLGPNLPVDEVVAAAQSLDAPAVGLSVSGFSDSVANRAAVAELAAKLPEGVRLWLGGAGARALQGLPERATRLDTLEDLERAVAELP